MMRRLAIALGVLGAVIVAGIAGYVLIEGWSVLDALYMTVITVGTVGYSEVHELTSGGRVFTMALIFGGFGAMIFFLGTVIDFVVEGHLRGYVEGRRMEKRIESLTGHHIVAGLGRVGSVVAAMLEEEDGAFVVIDADEERVEYAREQGWLVVEGDATAEETLYQAGVERARSLVTTLDTDADNLFVTFTARSLSSDIFIVARSSHESSEGKLRKAGANRVLTPNIIGGRRMATMVLHPVVSDFLDLVTHGDKVEFRLQEVELNGGSPLVGKTISEASVRDKTGAYILAIQSPSGTVNTNPSSDTMLEVGDRLVVLGTSSQLRSLTQVC